MQLQRTAGQKSLFLLSGLIKFFKPRDQHCHGGALVSCVAVIVCSCILTFPNTTLDKGNAF